MNERDFRVGPEQLHEWYLEATKELNPKSFNEKAQKPFRELTKEQQYIDCFIADKIAEHISNELKLAKEHFKDLKYLAYVRKGKSDYRLEKCKEKDKEIARLEAEKKGLKAYADEMNAEKKELEERVLNTDKTIVTKHGKHGIHDRCETCVEIGIKEERRAMIARIVNIIEKKNIWNKGELITLIKKAALQHKDASKT